MKKPFTLHLNYFTLVLFLLFLSFNSCQKDNNEIKANTSSIIQEAKAYFQQNYNEKASLIALNGKTNPSPFEKLKKNVLWDKAKIQQISLGEAVKVPILFDNEYFVSNSTQAKSKSLFSLSYLMMYKDKKNKMHTEWVITIPDNDSGITPNNKMNFSGTILVFNWDGSYLKSYKITNDGGMFISNHLSINKHNKDLKTQSQGIKTLSGFVCTTISIHVWEPLITRIYTDVIWIIPQRTVNGLPWCHMTLLNLQVGELMEMVVEADLITLMIMWKKLFMKQLI